MKTSVAIIAFLLAPFAVSAQFQLEYSLGGGAAIPQGVFAEKNTDEAGVALNGMQYHGSVTWMKKYFGLGMQYKGNFFPVDAQSMADVFSTDFPDIQWHITSKSWFTNGFYVNAMAQYSIGKFRVQAVAAEGAVIYTSPEITISGISTDPYVGSYNNTMQSKSAWGLGLNAELRFSYFITEHSGLTLSADYMTGKAAFENVQNSASPPSYFQQKFASYGLMLSYNHKI